MRTLCGKQFSIALGEIRKEVAPMLMLARSLEGEGPDLRGRQLHAEELLRMGICQNDAIRYRLAACARESAAEVLLVNATEFSAKNRVLESVLRLAIRTVCKGESDAHASAELSQI